ncbi:flagellar hook protein FlgE [Proteiniborus sp. MB09-C3]|uniref:flagellar hook protein FlgE n=1 Tax=Proteiniborus sp. MB09-C3 TaxID=3050072 RepID=UPI0025562806|nr:flagellar hook protein FlgE [Proteiniborus sp. MB09-C3]WIV10863.1 flagellar hook protein FlgE [Proteiniborus sp. MB09-C3]
MMRSMYSGVSGLRVHQTKMDVIGNNIANVNTVGFKRGQVTFQEVFSQVVRGASAPQGGKGGTNPQQIGLGVNIGSISTVHTKGAVQRTDNPTDLMIDGEGFFVVTDDPNFQNKFYTRAGNFDVDGAGNLITADGFKILGYKFVDGKWTSEIGPITINKTETVPPTTTKDVEFRGNLDSRIGLPYKTVEVTDNSDPDNPVTKYKLVLNPDGFHKTDTIIRDSLGNGYKVEFEIFRDFAEAKDRFDTSGEWPEEYDGTEYATKAEAEAALLNGISTGAWKTRMVSVKPLNGDSEIVPNNASLFHDLVFSTEGKLVSGNKFTLEITKAGVGFGKVDSNGVYGGKIEFDLSKLTQYANEADAKPHALNGNTAGVLDGFAIDATGTIIASFTNNEKRELGQLILAKFDNPAGLQKIGNNFFIDTRNSGEAQIGRAGTTGLGAIAPGSLEMSNVDLSLEFTEMITTQRGFQANSRIITTSDEMLQELVNMKR